MIGQDVGQHETYAQMTAPQTAPVQYHPLGRTALILLPFALGYFLSYLFRAVNAVVAPNLVSELGLTAGELGFLTAAYLLAFALFQLPLAIVEQLAAAA